MQGLRLPAHIWYGLSRGERIFLDLEADLYFQLAPEEERMFASVERRDLNEASSSRRLVEQGLLCFAATGRPVQPTRAPEPSRSLVEQEEVEISWHLGDLIEVFFDLAWARFIIRRRELHKLMNEEGEQEPASAQIGLEQAVATFRGARAFAPFRPNCLRDSLALRRYLARRSLCVQLVIGAKLHPFSAHCWLQQGELALNDSLSGARGFAPILVLP